MLVDYSGVWDDTDVVHFNGSPVPNDSTITFGTNTFTEDYSDNSLGGTAMTLTAVASGTPFQVWAATPAFGLNPADRDPGDDPDGDGVYTIQSSASLAAWDEAVAEVSPASTLSPAPNSGWTARTFKVTDSDGLPDKRFMRVIVTD